MLREESTEQKLNQDLNSVPLRKECFIDMIGHLEVMIYSNVLIFLVTLIELIHRILLIC